MIDMKTHRQLNANHEDPEIAAGDAAAIAALEKCERIRRQKASVEDQIRQSQDQVAELGVLDAHYAKGAPAGAVLEGGLWYVPK